MRKREKELVVVVTNDDAMCLCHDDEDVKLDALDSVEYWAQHDRDGHVVELLYQAQRCWDDMDAWRRKRRQAEDFVYTNQYKEYITVDGVRMTEEDYIRSIGQEPLTNNLERRLINNVVGTYINQDKEPTCTTRDKTEQVYGQTLSTLLQYNRQVNKLNTKMARAFEEWLWSGMVAMRLSYGWRGRKLDVWVDSVDMNTFFCDSDAKDVDSFSMMGQVHELSKQELYSRFVHGKSLAEINAQVKMLEEEYRLSRDASWLVQNYKRFGYSELKQYDFLQPYNVDKYRVVEIWTKESRKVFRFWDKGKGEVFCCVTPEEIQNNVYNVNNRRIGEAIAAGIDLTLQPIALIEPVEGGVEEYWYCRYVTPTGRVLYECENPYAHSLPPYVVCAGSMIDGEVHSFESTFHDQQKYINRLITLQDWIMKSSAKGVLLAPEGAFDGQDIDEVAAAWARFDGVIYYKPKPGVPMPQQISANSTNVGIHELLSTELKLFEDISGVNGALQGKSGYSATSGVLYAQQMQNGTTSLMSCMLYFSQFTIDVSNMQTQLIQQYYDPERVLEIVGEEGELKDFDVEKCLNMAFDISITESTSTPAYRQIANQFLFQLRQLGDIDGETMLEAGDFPYSDKILQLMQAKQQKMMQAQQEAQQQAQAMEPDNA